MNPFYPTRVLITFLVVTLSSIAAADDPVASDILGKSDEIRFPSQGFQVDIDITSTTPGETAEQRKYRILSKGNDNTVVMILEPASERGQIMLMKGRDLWVFMPALKKITGVRSGKVILIN